MRFLKSLILLIVLAAVLFPFRDTISTKLNGVLGERLTSDQTATSTGELSVSLPEPLVKALGGASSSNALTAEGVLALTNKEREKEGLADLTLNQKLVASADRKTDDMFAKGYFAHESPSGVGPADLAKTSGYDYLSIGENLALGGFKDDKDLVAAWMASPGHRANILGKNYTEIGIVVKYASYQGAKQWIAVQEFGTPASLCSKPSDTLASQASASTGKLKTMKETIDALKAQIEASSGNQNQYNSLVGSYNAMVRTYDDLVEQVQNVINTYNSEISNFNTCLKAHTS